MSKGSKKDKSPRKNEASLISKCKLFFTNERTIFITGLLIGFLVIYLSMVMFSFIFTGASDQSKVENVPLSELLLDKTSVQNWGGIRGAYIAEFFFNQLFGISSFLILFFLGSLSLHMMRIKRIPLLKYFFFSTICMIWGSIFFAFTFIEAYEDSFLYLGGKHGYWMSEILIKNIGVFGTILFLLVFLLVLTVITSAHSIPFLQRIFSLKWVPKRTKPAVDVEKKEEPEEVLPQPERIVIEKEEDVFEEEEPFLREEPKPISEKPFEIEIAVGDEPDEFIEEEPSFKINKPTEEEVFYGDIQSLFDPTLDLSNYKHPHLDLLKKYDMSNFHVDYAEQEANQQRIVQTLEDFGIKISSIRATVGPTITLYEVVPENGVRISKIRNLGDDIALSLSALGIRIIAPMPGKGTVGIEVPNKDPQIVSMQSVLATKKFKECTYDLPVVLGKTITNEIFMFDLCKMPHLLVAGATGQGKSVGLNALITSLLYKKHPSELKFVMIDPKMVEFNIYSAIERHFLAKLPDAENAIITDFKKVAQTLQSLCQEMDERYDLLMKAHARNIKEYNDKYINRKLNPEKGHRYMPFIVVIIDEFGDLIMTAGKEIEMPIARIAQKARAVGIHMVIATQRPTTTIITGTIKANFPARMAFKVSSMIDSRTILDAGGANQLIGRGDLLFSQGSDMTRVQCAFIDTPEVEEVATFIGEQQGYPTALLLPEYSPEGETKAPGSVDLSERDPMFDEAARLIVMQQQGSTSLIQRKFAIGYNRAGRLMDQLEAAGIVGAFEGSKPRQVLVSDEYSLEQLLNSLK